ncbi:MULTISPECIES: hypothetical protein [unclassified Mesorhizobium]|uniref:hypothetical protein n=1 Tax=unclassified Mesorhizobium TaxID=325217 RepID=UPI0015E2D845|nr:MULTISPECIES: hypothetical protein [unclassified Mesorhizobium]MBZ9983403.1 hypothetical protein [Mesorhizobium sp. BR-1-1-8]
MAVAAFTFAGKAYCRGVSGKQSSNAALQQFGLEGAQDGFAFRTIQEALRSAQM